MSDIISRLRSQIDGLRRLTPTKRAVTVSSLDPLTVTDDLTGVEVPDVQAIGFVPEAGSAAVLEISAGVARLWPVADGDPGMTRAMAEQLELVREDLGVVERAAEEASAAVTAAVEGPVAQAMESANGRNSRITSVDPPTGSTHPTTGLPLVEGDTWWQWDSTVTKNVVAAWVWRGGGWVAEQLGDAVLAALDVNKLTVTGLARINEAVVDKIVGDAAYFDSFSGRVVNGADIYSPSATALPRVHVGGSVVEVVRGDEGAEYRAVSLGGSAADEMMLYDAAGHPIAGFTSAGAGVTTGEHSVGSLRVGGEPLGTILDPLNRGLLAQWVGSSNFPRCGNTPLGLVDFRYVPMIAGRMYWLTLIATYVPDTPGDRLSLQLRYRSDGAVAGVASTLARNYVHVLDESQEPLEFTVLFRPTVTGNYGFLFCYQNATANRGIRCASTGSAPAQAWIADAGPVPGITGRATAGGGTPFTAADTVIEETPAQTTTRVYTSTALRSWRGGSPVTDYLHHGRWDGIDRYSMIGFEGTTMVADLAGATIDRVRVRLVNAHTWSGSGMTARIGRTATATTVSAPASPVTSGTSPTSVSWPRLQDMWVTMPAGWWTPSMRSIVLGEGAPALGNAGYGKFSYSTAACQIEITYTK